MRACVSAARAVTRVELRVPLIALLLAAAGNPQLARAGGEPAGEWLGRWYDAQVAVFERAQRDGLTLLAHEAMDETDVPAAAVLPRLETLVRARLTNQAGALIEQLASKALVIDREARFRTGCSQTPECPAGCICIDLDTLNEVAYSLLERGELDLLVRLCEAFPQAAVEPSALRDHLQALGFDEAQLDAWYADRIRRGDSDAVLRQWAISRAQSGRFDELFGVYCDALRRTPESRRAVERVLAVAQAATEPPKLGWIGEVYRPACVSDVLAISSQLPPLAQRPLLEWARNAAIQEDEVQALRARLPIPITDQAAHAAIRQDVLTRLVECYRALGEAQCAQDALESLARQSGDVPQGLALLAGSVQAASGGHVIETRILAAEEEQSDSPRYWMTRASYYTGRAEWSAAEDALRRALELAPRPETDEQTRGARADRAVVIAAFANFLATQRGVEPAASFVRDELTQSSGEYAAAVAHQFLELVLRHGLTIGSDDAAMWTYLRQRPTWESLEERLLYEVARACPVDQRSEFWSRLEVLADGADVSRAKTAGWVMTRSGENGRAIPWLRDAVARTADSRERAAAEFTLYEAFRDTANWRGAAEALAAASGHLTPAERVEHLTTLAVKAARAGESERALALWRARLRVDWSERELSELASSVACSSLAALYAEIADACPQSDAPARADAILHPAINGTGPGDEPRPAR